jgi:hypothetical protein
MIRSDDRGRRESRASNRERNGTGGVAEGASPELVHSFKSVGGALYDTKEGRGPLKEGVTYAEAVQPYTDPDNVYEIVCAREAQ